MRVFVGVVLGVWAAWTGGALAEARSYEMSLSGITGGLVTLDARENHESYAVGGRIRATGLIGAVARFGYDGNARGARIGGSFRPERYEGRADTGRRQSSVVMAYRDGVPEVLTYDSPREAGPDAPDPSTQGGTLDPLTAIHALLRDVRTDEACRLDVVLFDGRRRSRFALRPAPTVDGNLRCAGEYRRLQGYTAEELKRRTGFPFTVEYVPGAGGTWQVERVSFRSLYGPAVLRRARD